MNFIALYLAAFIAAFLVSFLTLPAWRRWCLRTGHVDDPGHRKIHSEPIPLAGGLAVMTGLLVPLGAALVVLAFQQWLASGPAADDGADSWTRFLRLDPDLLHRLTHGLNRRAGELSAIFIGAIGMLMVGLWDDKHELRPAVKFSAQFAVALLVAAAGVRVTLFVPSTVFSYAITALWILTVINAFNFMDNMNGLCTGLGVIGAFYFVVAAGIGGQYLVALIAALTCGALAGFLPRNFPRALAFLGDAGSHLVGYLLAVLAILPHFHTADQPRAWAVLSPLLVLAVPLFDLVCVVWIRTRLGKPFYVGDNNHLSHRLVRRGWTRTRAVIWIWVLALLLGLPTILW